MAYVKPDEVGIKGNGMNLYLGAEALRRGFPGLVTDTLLQQHLSI